MFDYLSVIQEYDLKKVTKFYMRGRHMGFVQNERVPLLLNEAPHHFTFRSGGLHLADSAASDATSITAALALGHTIVAKHNDTSIQSPAEDMAVSFQLDPSKPDAHRVRNNNIFSLPYYGAHLNIYSRSGSDVKLWLARRSEKVFTYKGCWDIGAGGSISLGYSPFSAVWKEAAEEAGVDEMLKDRLRFVRVVDQTFDSLYQHGLHLDRQYYFDLEVPENFSPTPLDQEAEAFVSVSAEEAWVMLQDGRHWKHNAAVTVLDFGLRHGLFNPAADVVAHINACLHQQLPLDDLPTNNRPLDETAA